MIDDKIQWYFPASLDIESRKNRLSNDQSLQLERQVSREVVQCKIRGKKNQLKYGSFTLSLALRRRKYYFDSSRVSNLLMTNIYEDCRWDIPDSSTVASDFTTWQYNLIRRSDNIDHRNINI